MPGNSTGRLKVTVVNLSHWPPVAEKTVKRAQETINAIRLPINYLLIYCSLSPWEQHVVYHPPVLIPPTPQQDPGWVRADLWVEALRADASLAGADRLD